MARGRMDQVSAWIGAVFMAGLLFGGVYLLSSLGASTVDHSIPERPKEDQDREEDPVQPDRPKSENVVPSELPQWGYRGSSGPEHWATLSPDYKLCATGKRQSPVDITRTRLSNKALPIRFRYKEAELSLRHNGVALRADYKGGSYVEINGDRFDLTHFEFHAPSEHKVDSIPYDMELQLYHRDTQGSIAVISVLLEEGDASPAIAKLFAELPQRPGDIAPGISFNVSALLPKRRSYYYYPGSLTRPPCSQGISWFVLTRAVSISAKQVDQFVSVIKFNARPIQKRNGRKIVKSKR